MYSHETRCARASWLARASDCNGGVCDNNSFRVFDDSVSPTVVIFLTRKVVGSALCFLALPCVDNKRTTKTNTELTRSIEEPRNRAHRRAPPSYALNFTVLQWSE